VIRTLNDIGIRTRITDQAVEQTLSKGKSSPEDLLFVTWTADYPDADGMLYSVIHSTGAPWAKRCSLPHLDRLTEQARAETDPEERHSLYRRIEEEVRERAILIPLLHDTFQCITRPEVDGLVLNYFDPLIAFEHLTLNKR
jgi:dipeptide transport system substrate-binding protein